MLTHEQTRISVITVTYNSEKYLEQTIESVRAQNWGNLQYILVDGGSKDRTLDIVQKHEDLFHTIISEPDRGISDAMNKGIKLCDGELIGMIHSDDWYEPGCFARVAKVWADKKPGIIHGYMRYWEQEKPSYLHEARQELLHEEMTINHPTCFVSKEIYQNFGGMDLLWKYAMDYELMLRFFNAGVSFYCVKEVLANMRLDGVSDRRWLYTHNEVRQIQEFHSKQLLWPKLRFIKNLLRHGAGRLLSQCGLESLKIWWRKNFAKVPKTL